MELKINEKFRTVAPPLSENEMLLLREDILANGCRDPLIVWNGVIVDGHHRYKICRENKGGGKGALKLSKLTISMFGEE